MKPKFLDDEEIKVFEFISKSTTVCGLLFMYWKGCWKFVYLDLFSSAVNGSWYIVLHDRITNW